MGDLRNKWAKDARDERHRQWMAKHRPASGPPPPPPRCGCGALATFMASGLWDTFAYCPSCLPDDPTITPAREIPVCNLYSHTKGPKAIRELAKAMRASGAILRAILSLNRPYFPTSLRRSCARQEMVAANLSRCVGDSRSRQPAKAKKPARAMSPMFATREAVGGSRGWSNLITAAWCR